MSKIRGVAGWLESALFSQLLVAILPEEKELVYNKIYAVKARIDSKKDDAQWPNIYATLPTQCSNLEEIESYLQIYENTGASMRT